MFFASKCYASCINDIYQLSISDFYLLALSFFPEKIGRPNGIDVSHHGNAILKPVITKYIWVIIEKQIHFLLV